MPGQFYSYSSSLSIQGAKPLQKPQWPDRAAAIVDVPALHRQMRTRIHIQCAASNLVTSGGRTQAHHILLVLSGRNNAEFDGQPSQLVSDHLSKTRDSSICFMYIPEPALQDQSYICSKTLGGNWAHCRCRNVSKKKSTLYKSGILRPYRCLHPLVSMIETL